MLSSMLLDAMQSIVVRWAYWLDGMFVCLFVFISGTMRSSGHGLGASSHVRIIDTSCSWIDCGLRTRAHPHLATQSG
jgi:hypothetical protein